MQHGTGHHMYEYSYTSHMIYGIALASSNSLAKEKHKIQSMLGINQ